MSKAVISRQVAKQQGLKFYFTGKPCVYGHVSDRLTSTGVCRECKRTDARRRYHEDVNSSREYYRSRMAAERTEPNSAASLWAKRNQDKAKLYRTKWLQSRPGVMQAHNAKRHAAKVNATPTVISELDELVIAEAFELAQMRTKSTGIQWDVDHMVPLRAKTACGLHVASNLQVIPHALNVRKRNKMVYTEPCEWVGAL